MMPVQKNLVKTRINTQQSVLSPKAKAHPDDASSGKPVENSTKPQAENDGDKSKGDSTDSASIYPKCPFGYDAQSFKIGPELHDLPSASFESSKCIPCSHVYCKACISSFKDCPLCGADIKKIEADTNLQDVLTASLNVILESSDLKLLLIKRKMKQVKIKK